MAREEAERFTILFPIKIVLNSFPGFSIHFNTSVALLSPSSARERILCRFVVVSAVSAEEKNADSINKIIKNTNCIEVLGSKLSSPNLLFVLELFSILLEGNSSVKHLG